VADTTGSLYSNGSFYIDLANYEGDSCGGDSYRSVTATSLNVSRGGCVDTGYRVYSSNTASRSSSSSKSESSASGSSSDTIVIEANTKRSGIGTGDSCVALEPKDRRQPQKRCSSCS